MVSKCKKKKYSLVYTALGTTFSNDFTETKFFVGRVRISVKFLAVIYSESRHYSSTILVLNYYLEADLLEGISS